MRITDMRIETRKAPSHSRLAAMDCVRLLAMMLVALQHIMSVCGLVPPFLFFHLDVGQTGVAIFFAISGYLAIKGRTNSIRTWLSKRLIRIFVPYWIALTGVFVLNHAVGYKPVTISLVISEYLGLAGFTHRNALVGVHFWFISLLLLCYLIAAIVRWKPWLLYAISAVCCFWLSTDLYYAGHTLAFLTGLWLGRKDRLDAFEAVTVALLGTAFAVFVNPGFSCMSVGVLVIAISLCPLTLRPTSARTLADASDLSYYFYLVHGPIYLALANWVSQSILLVMILGTVLSWLGGFVLRRIESLIRGRFTMETNLPNPPQTAKESIA